MWAVKAGDLPKYFALWIDFDNSTIALKTDEDVAVAKVLGGGRSAVQRQFPNDPALAVQLHEHAGVSNGNKRQPVGLALDGGREARDLVTAALFALAVVFDDGGLLVIDGEPLSVGGGMATPEVAKAAGLEGRFAGGQVDLAKLVGPDADEKATVVGRKLADRQVELCRGAFLTQSRQAATPAARRLGSS